MGISHSSQNDRLIYGSITEKSIKVLYIMFKTITFLKFNLLKTKVELKQYSKKSYE